MFVKKSPKLANGLNDKPEIYAGKIFFRYSSAAFASVIICPSTHDMAL